MLISIVGKSGRNSWIERDKNFVKITNNESHCCGLQGYDPMLGDICPACEIDHELHEALRNETR